MFRADFCGFVVVCACVRTHIKAQFISFLQLFGQVCVCVSFTFSNAQF